MKETLSKKPEILTFQEKDMVQVLAAAMVVGIQLAETKRFGYPNFTLDEALEKLKPFNEALKIAVKQYPDERAVNIITSRIF